jgi:hypothetical protein
MPSPYFFSRAACVGACPCSESRCRLFRDMRYFPTIIVFAADTTSGGIE